MIGNLMGGVWKYAAAAAGVAAAVLFALWKIADAKRETAEVRSEVDRANLQASEKVREKSKAVSRAKADARREAEEVARDIEARREDRRRRRVFGDPRWGND